MTVVAEQNTQVLKVLIADDDPGIARFLANRCRKMGFEVQMAANGLQALIMAGRNPPDVLIADINMPELDGLSVCSRLLLPDRKRMQVIIITASSYSETVERCQALGAFHVRKGLDLWDGVQSKLIELFPGVKSMGAERDKSPLRVEWKRPRVLVVDGDPDVATFLTSRLNKHGVDTLAAYDAVEGYRMACKEEPSVILTDNAVPQGGANYLLSRLRTTEATGNIPVVVMTAQRLDDSTRVLLKREVCGRPGAALFLEKSFDTTELFTAIKKYCAFMENKA
jgi:CheY-like chemotaxis protein